MSQEKSLRHVRSPLWYFAIQIQKTEAALNYMKFIHEVFEGRLNDLTSRITAKMFSNRNTP